MSVIWEGVLAAVYRSPECIYWKYETEYSALYSFIYKLLPWN
jgi:hypothetical protein